MSSCAPGPSLGKGASGGAWGFPVARMRRGRLESLAKVKSRRPGQAAGQDQAGEVWSPPFYRLKGHFHRSHLGGNSSLRGSLGVTFPGNLEAGFIKEISA